MSKIRVLAFDETTWPIIEMADVHGLDIEIEILGLRNVRDRASQLAINAREHMYELVVLYGQLESAYVLAQLLSENIRTRTLIVWPNDQPGREQDYTILGYSYFCLRRDQAEGMWQILKPILRERNELHFL